MFWDHFAEDLSKKLNSWALEPLAVFPMGLVVLIFVADSFDPNITAGVLAMLVALSPIWMPLYFLIFFWITWIDYVRLMFWFSQNYVLLEVQLPQTVDKNPAAFETFLAMFHNAGGETTFLARMWKGSFRPIWALEIASNEGRIGFYIHMRRAFRNIAEARFYGQFPEAKLVEVDDYAARINFNLDEYDIFGSEYQKAKPEALPIKTYIDWGLDKDPKEEFKIDPITNILELLGQVGKNEYFWMQIILKTRRGETEWYGFRFGKDEYTHGAEEEIGKIIKGAAERNAKLATKDKAKMEQIIEQASSRGTAILTQGERTRVERIESSLSKLTFECGIRVIYMARKENHQGINNGAIIRLFDTFKGQDAKHDYNALGVTRGTTIFDYPWQDFRNTRLNILKESLFFHYKNRAYFYVPYDQVPVIMNTEEIATLWHMPSAVVQTPGLSRVPSRRSEAPVNLPV
jgi:hypothetical protein